MKIFLAPKIRKSLLEKLIFVKSDFLDLVNFDFLDIAHFAIIDRFLIFPSILLILSLSVVFSVSGFLA